MKVYTDTCNFLSLKIALASEVSGCKVQFESPTGKENYGPKKFPILELESGDHLFSTNSICRFILEKSGYETSTIACEEWINWESVALTPFTVNVVQSSHNGSKISDDLKSSLNSALSLLNSYLSAHSNLPSNGGVNPGLADICVWSTLYLMAEDDKLDKEYLADLEAVRNWYAGIKGLQSAHNAVQRVLEGKNVAAFKDILLAVSIPVGSNKETQVKGQPITNSPDEILSTDIAISPEEILSAVDNWSGGLRPADQRKPVSCPVLPKDGERNVLVTSALPYVNNVPHLGNIIGSVMSADVFAKYCRLRQYNTIYICGTDEYGTATETKALEEKLTPEQICSKYFKVHKDIYDWFGLEFDHFGRTSTPQQTEICQDIFWKLYNNGYVTKDTTEQLHCGNCDRFLADRFVEGICPFCTYNDARGDQCDKCQKLINPIELIQPRCKICGQTPQVKSSQHLYLDLPKLQPLIKDFLDTSTKDSHWSTTAKVISYAWLKEGLKQRCITRDLKWGVPVPLEGFTNKVFYVWYDAPIGYLSISKEYTPQWEKWWKNPDNVQLYQFMAKDNVAFHAIIFPSCQIGTKDNYTKVNHLSAVEYLNYEDSKFSKSRGIGVFGSDARNTGIPADIYRFYLLYIRPESQDTVFSWLDFMTKNNSELLNNLGNYVNRASTFIFNNFDAKVPEITLNEDDKLFLAQINRELNSYISKMERIKLRDGLRVFLNISKLGNQHIQANKPWELIKGTEELKARAGSVVGLSVNVACLLSLLMNPYMPNIGDEIRNQLNFPGEKKVLTNYFFRFLPAGHPINKPVPLFKKIEQAEMEELKRIYAGKQDSEERNGGGGENPKVETIAEVKQAGPAEIEAMNALVAQQGNKVRELKSQKAAKINIDAEVAILLNLKLKLNELCGTTAAAPGGKKGKK